MTAAGLGSQRPAHFSVESTYIEQSVWNPNTGTFFISVPAFNGNQGGVAEINTDGTVGALTQFSSIAGGPAACSSTGLALGTSGNLLVGCASGQAVLLHIDPITHLGSIVSLFPQISGTDEVWFDAALGDFFLTGVDSSGGRVFDVISDTSDLLLQSVSLGLLGVSSNAHSISVDPVSGDVFLPLPGSTPFAANTLCPLGCVAVFAQNQTVPEPPTYALLLTALGLMGWAARRRKQIDA